MTQCQALAFPSPGFPTGCGDGAQPRGARCSQVPVLHRAVWGQGAAACWPWQRTAFLRGPGQCFGDTGRGCGAQEAAVASSPQTGDFQQRFRCGLSASPVPAPKGQWGRDSTWPLLSPRWCDPGALFHEKGARGFAKEDSHHSSVQ